jgi:hypothetical protein
MAVEPKPKPDARKGRLQDRPGWSSLIAAAHQLHGAELLIGDPVGDPNLARVHLREFWILLHTAARAVAVTTTSDPGAWLAESTLPGLSPARRARCLAHWTRWIARDEPAPALGRSALRVHVRDARAVVGALEPIIGGIALKRRRWVIAGAITTTLLLVGPAIVWQIATETLPGPGPWRGAYYPDRELESDPVLRRDLDVEFDFGVRGPMDEIPPDKFSVRWDTCLELEEPTDAIFQMRANDGARFYVDGELIIDAWDRNPKTKTRGFGSGSVELEAGVHHLRAEMFESLGGASAVLVASLDGGVPKPIPYQTLIYPGDEIDEDDPCAAAR